VRSKALEISEKHYLESNRITIEQYQAAYQNILPFITNLLQDTNIKNRFNNDLEKFRKNKNNHYWMNSGTMKLSTIYSSDATVKSSQEKRLTLRSRIFRTSTRISCYA
jgi:hypothetical protein